MNRDERLDVLRSIGLLCIVLAHVKPPSGLFQIRNFDVPLLVLVAGSAYAASNHNRPKSGYFEYIKKRFIRLVIPTWVFLLTFFLVTFAASLLMHRSFPYSPHKMLSSFLLLDGIGYVWIIRIFFLVSLIAPFANYCAEYIDSAPKKALAVFLFIYLTYEFMVHSVPNSNQILLNVILNEILYVAIPYGCIFFIGTRLYALSRNKILIATFILFAVFVAYAIIIYLLNGHFVPTQKYKYPPTAYYILYALFASASLYWMFQTNLYSYIPGKQFLSFLGRSSMWVYLWHILVLYLISWSNIDMNFAAKYVVVLGTAAGIALTQMFVLDKVLLSTSSERTKEFLITVFSG